MALTSTPVSFSSAAIVRVTELIPALVTL